MDDYPHPSQANTSIVIPSAGFRYPDADTSMLQRCLETLVLLKPSPAEVIVVVGDEYQGEPPQKLAHLPISVIHRGAGPFDYSRAVNCGVLASSGDFVLMLNDDIEAETSDWLETMGTHLADRTVGAVGAMLLYPDRSIQHIGIEFEDGQPVHPYRSQSLSEVAESEAVAAHDVACVTGACLLARRRDLLLVGAMSPEFPISYGDIDLCLRLTRLGLRTVVEPAATLIHHESSSREPVIEPWETDRFLARWADLHHLEDSGISDNYDSPMTDDLADASDVDSLRYEILRLRDQTLGIGAQHQYLRNQIAHQASQIEELRAKVAERDQRIAEREERIAERDQRIAERDQRIAEQDARLSEQHDRVAERDLRLAERDLRLRERDAHLAANNAQIADLAEERDHLRQQLARPLLLQTARRIIGRSPKHG